MELAVTLIPILEDNYVFLIKSENLNDVSLVDSGESKQCLEILDKNHYDLKSIFITHHHDDHIEGIANLKRKFPNAIVYAPEKNKIQIPLADVYVYDSQKITVGKINFDVIELPGHTLGILGYFEPEAKLLFSGDVLFGLGCGRLFEGTAQMLYQSLNKIKQLPPETLVYCTHEYTETNLRFTEMLIETKKIPPAIQFRNLQKL